MRDVRRIAVRSCVNGIALATTKGLIEVVGREDWSAQRVEASQLVIRFQPRIICSPRHLVPSSTGLSYRSSVLSQL